MKCSLCGAEDEHMIYEIINLVRGGEVVGHLCGDCASKVLSQEKQIKRT